MLISSAIQKGKDLENYVAHQIEVKGLGDARRSIGSGSGNREKSDIDTSLMILGRNAGIECKNHKTLAIPEWWRQVEKLEKLGREPILIFKINREPFEATKVVMYLDTVLDLIKKSQEPKTLEKIDNKQQQYHLNQLRFHAHKLLKELEQ